MSVQMKFCVAMVCGAIVVSSYGAGLARAEHILVGDSVDFIDVNQTSSTNVPGNLFGSFEVVGNKLDFNPVDGPGFGASSGDGTTDITDGSLSFTVMANQDGATITSLIFGESGDYTVRGLGSDNLGTNGTNVSVATLIRIDVLAGAPVGSFEFPMALTFNPSGGTINLGDTPPFSGFWTGNGVIDVESFAPGATKLHVVLNNQLTASSEVITYEALIGTEPDDIFGLVTGTTSAIIVKKDFMVTVETRVPEPATLIGVVLGGIVCALASARRKRKS